MSGQSNTYPALKKPVAVAAPIGKSAKKATKIVAPPMIGDKTVIVREPAKPQFFLSFNDNGIMVKFHDMSFGIKKNNKQKYDSVSANILENGDMKYVTLIQRVLRDKVKTDTYENIVKEFTTKGELATSIRIFHSRITTVSKDTEIAVTNTVSA